MKKQLYPVYVIMSMICLCACGQKAAVPPTGTDVQASVSEDALVPGPEKQDYEDLIYYGETSIWIAKDDKITVNLAFLENIDDLESVCVRNCMTGQNIELPVEENVTFTSEKDGTYYVYAVTDAGDTIDRSDKIGYTHTYTNDSGTIGLDGGTGIIGL